MVIWHRQPFTPGVTSTQQLGYQCRGTGRVRRWRCRHPLPSEPDVKVSPSSGSSRGKAPRERSRFTRYQSRPLDDTGWPPSGLSLTLEPITVGAPRRVGGCTRGSRHVHLQFPPTKVLPAFSSSSTRWKSARFRGEVRSPLLSARLQDGVGFFQHPLSAIPIALLAESPTSARREDGFTMFRSTSIGWVGPCLLHRQSSGPCACMLKTSSLTAYRFGRSLSAPLARYV